MSYIKSKNNILKNIVVCLCSLVVSICVAEYVLRSVTIDGFSGYKLYMGQINSKIYLAVTPMVSIGEKKFILDSGHCYPSDPTGSFPLKIVNPDDGRNWHCVAYNRKQRLEGYNPERERQIALVGDSFTIGYGVNETDTLGYVLNGFYPEINFQNWGKGGADIDVVSEECKEIFKSVHRIDEVVYFYNLNDVRMSKEVRSELKSIIDFQNIRWLKDEQRYSPLVAMLSKSALFSVVRKTWVVQRDSSLTVQNYKDMYLSEKNRQEFLSTMDEIRSMKDMLAQHGISFRMIIYPLLYKDLLGRYPFENIHAAIIHECNERGIICLDGYVPFKKYYSLKKFAVHPLDYHPNGSCNRELVHYLYEKDFITGNAQ